MKKLGFAFSLLFSTISFANEPVQRVISLAPHATEIAYAAGLGNKLIAVSVVKVFDTYPCTCQ